MIEKAVEGRLSVREAALLLGRSPRQVQRLKRRYHPQHLEWVRHGNCGKPKPWALPAALQQTVLALARGKYAGFNDSHLHQKLLEAEGVRLSRECLRRLLRRAGLASPQKRRPRQYRARRERRSRFGMMLLTDASRHDWLQGRGPQLTLIGFQDDATSQMLAAHFQLEPENSLGYFRALHSVITTHGVPLSLYRDCHSVFQRNDPHWSLAEELAGKQLPTHFGRALEELAIQQIPAHSPQAKGRIERAWRTFQDRLCSELRLAGATTLEQANLVLARFCADYNQRFAVAARQADNDFRPLPRNFALDRCLSFRYQRVVGSDHVIAFDALRLQLPPAKNGRGYSRQKVELSHQLDGMLRVFHHDQCLAEFAVPLAEHSPATTALRSQARLPQPKTPRIYNLGGRPAMAAS